MDISPSYTLWLQEVLTVAMIFSMLFTRMPVIYQTDWRYRSYYRVRN
jgi:hypothetical protein